MGLPAPRRRRHGGRRVTDVLVVVGADQMPRHGAVGIRLRVGAAAGSKRPCLLGAHPGQIQDHDCGCRSQVPHQDRRLLVVHELAPWPSLDPARNRHLHRAGARPLSRESVESAPGDDGLDLGPSAPGDRGNVVVRQGDTTRVVLAAFTCACMRRRSSQAARMSPEKSSTRRIDQVSKGPITVGSSGSVLFSPPASAVAAGR